MAPEKKAPALAHYLEGVGLRATERLVGVSHNAVMNWVWEEVEGKSLAMAKPEEVEFVEADELRTYVGGVIRSGAGFRRVAALPAAQRQTPNAKR